MKNGWIKQCLVLSEKPAHFYSGCRKILRGIAFTIAPSNDLTMADSGFTKSKTSMLIRNYLNEPARQAGLELWKKRLGQGTYGSVGFSTYNHFKKGNVDGSSKRGSVMGPCIQSVVLTLMKNNRVEIDVFYRTTELFKKFPADLVFLRDVLLPPFKVKPALIRFHFANVTLHPMYFVTLIPHFDTFEEVRAVLDDIKKRDKHFFDWIVKWTARYVCKENMRGIQKFAQAMRVHKDANERIPPHIMKPLQKYLRKNHPGYRNEYTAPEEEEE